MIRDEAGDRTERHARPDAERGEDRVAQDDAADQYEGGVLKELEAHQFLPSPVGALVPVAFLRPLPRRGAGPRRCGVPA